MDGAVAARCRRHVLSETELRRRPRAAHCCMLAGSESAVDLDLHVLDLDLHGLDLLGYGASPHTHIYIYISIRM